jgi:hypothetical protein
MLPMIIARDRPVERSDRGYWVQALPDELRGRVCQPALQGGHNIG